MSLIIITGEIIIFLAAAAFFAGTETAVTAITRPEYRKLKKSVQKSAQRLARLVEIRDKIVSTALIGTNFVNTLNSSLITAWTLSVFGVKAVPIATAAISVLIIILAEIFPKALASERAETIGKKASLPLSICYVLLYPIVAVFSILTKAVLIMVQPHKKAAVKALKKDELKLLVEIGEKDGALAAGEESLLRKAVMLRNVTLRAIMTPRTEIIFINATSPLTHIVEQFRASRFSRLPVYTPETKTFVGIMHYKTILFALEEKQTVDLTSLLRPAIFVPEGASIFSVIKEMNIHMQNMAIVIDEHGGVSGLVTIDDIIAAVFNTVQDEYGKARRDPVHAVRFISSSKLVIPGTLRLEDCNELLHTRFHSNYYETLGGFLLERWGYLPREHDSIVCGKIRFTVTRIVDRRMETITADLSSAFQIERGFKDLALQTRKGTGTADNP